jgi:Gas vesicle synthesis protein GvpL/GvpF
MASGVKKTGQDKVLYLYGISRSAEEPSRKVAGVDDKAAVEQVRCAGMTCWISRVSKDDFADNLSRNMEDLEWLSEMTPRHQRVLAAIAETNDVLPARFGTVFLNEATLAADVQNRQAVLRSDLERIQGNEEWGVKVFAVRPEMAEIPDVKSGKSYLQAKSALLRARSPVTNDEEIARLASELEKFSLATAEGGKISGGRRDLRYQIALLVKRGEGKKLQSILKRFESEWKNTRHIECSGPWPPYSFVTRTF